MTESNRTPRTARASAAGFLALLLALAACTADLPTAESIDEMDVTDARARAEEAGLLVPKTVEGEPLYVVDGVIVDEDNANTITPDEIESIEVLKGAAAQFTYGDRAVNGVVRISTRSGERATATYEEVEPLGVPLTVEGRATMRRLEDGTSILIRAAEDSTEAKADDAYTTFEVEAGKFTFVDSKTPLIIVDGVIVEESFSLGSLSPDAIERIEIVKGAAARRLYEDARAANGVIHITTKTGGR